MTTANPRVLAALAATPLIAILRGIQVHESVAIVEALLASGMAVVEVPLNSPQALRSVRTLVEHFGDAIVCGAGTVLDATEVDGVATAGGQIVVSPNTDPAVITHAIELGLIPMPGAATPTEAFAALRAGARHLKMFPADQMGPATLKAWKSVLPSDVAVYPVGGVTPDNLADFLRVGAAGVGIGSALYKPGMSAAEVAIQARRFSAALRAARR